MDEKTEALREKADGTDTLLRERNLYKGKYRAFLKLINRTRNKLVQVTDHIEDEGDRAYFGSTNHADDLRELYDEMMSWIWDSVDETNRMKSDPYVDIRKQRARAEKAEAELESLLSERDRLREAARAVLKSWDERGQEQERLVTSSVTGNAYWSPAASMVSSEAMASLRAALNRRET